MSYKIAGIDVHKKVLIVVVIDASAPDCQPERRRFATMPSDLHRLLSWLREKEVKEAVMESTAQYWRSVWLELEPYMRLQLAQGCGDRSPVYSRPAHPIPNRKTRRGPLLGAARRIECALSICGEQKWVQRRVSSVSEWPTTRPESRNCAKMHARGSAAMSSAALRLFSKGRGLMIGGDCNWLIIMLRRAFLTALLMSTTTLVFSAKERILLNRIGPSQSTLFIAKADGSGERPLLPSSGFDYNASFSTDGNWIVFTSERDGSADIYRVHPDGSGLERLTDDPAYDDQGALSPDGKQLAFVSSRGNGSADIWVLNLTTKKARNLTNAPANFRPCWSSDGKWIAFSSDRNTPTRRSADRWEQLQEASLYLIRADGNGLRRITPHGKFAGSPRWSPDGKRIVFYEMDVKETFFARRSTIFPAQAVSQIVSVDVAAGTRQEHTSGPGLKVSPQFLSASRIGYVLKTGPRAGLAFTTGEQGAMGQMRNPSWSADGKWVVYQKYSSEARPQNQALFSRNLEFELAYSDPFPAFSHDGKKLALIDRLGSTDPTGVLAGVSIMDPNGTNVKRIFHDNNTLAVSPEWSPNGEWIVFGAGFYLANRGKPARLMMARPDGSELHELTKGSGNSGFPSWSPDGKRIVYRVWGESEHGLRIINLDDGSSTNLTTSYDNFPAWSPRGDVIAFTSFRDDDFDIYTIRPDGTGLRRLTTARGNDAHSVWSPDGKHILFSSSRLGFKDEAPLYDDVPQPYAELFVMNADGTNQRPLTDNQWEDGTPAWVPAFAPLATSRQQRIP